MDFSIIYYSYSLVQNYFAHNI
ncbi:MAG: hypothetical protein RJB03_1397, partial [Bacteroidota bacterium]